MIEIALYWISGVCLGASLASAIYARKFRQLHRAFSRNAEELETIRAALETGQHR